MAKIILREPNGPYQCEVDTGVMEVELREVYLGVGFVTDDGQRLSVCMRDGGFEVRHNDGAWVEFNSTPAPSVAAAEAEEAPRG